MKFELSHDRRNISDLDLLSELQRVAAEQSEQIVKQRTYKLFGKYGVTTVIRRFRFWNAAIEAAGLAKSVVRNVPDEDLFAGLYDLWVALGRQPNYSEVRSPHCRFHVATYERRFGSWRAALEAFVRYANSSDVAPPDGLQQSHAPARRTSRSIDLRLRFKVLNRDSFSCRSAARPLQFSAAFSSRLIISSPGQRAEKVQSTTCRRFAPRAMKARATCCSLD